MLHILESGWWVPENPGETVVGRIIHVGSFTKPNTSKLPGALQQGTKNGRVVVLQGRGGTAKIWMVENQVDHVDLLVQGAYARVMCTVPDTGYSEHRHYTVFPANRAEMTKLPKQAKAEEHLEEEEIVDPAQESGRRKKQRERAAAIEARFDEEAKHLVLTASRHGVLAKLFVIQGIQTLEDNAFRYNEVRQAIAEQMDAEARNQPPPPAPSTLAGQIDDRMQASFTEQRKQTNTAALIRVNRILNKAASELYSDHPVRLQIDEAINLLRTVEL